MIQSEAINDLRWACEGLDSVLTHETHNAILDAYDTLVREHNAAVKTRTFWKEQYIEAIERLKEARKQRDTFKQMADMWESHADSIVAELATTRAERDARLRDAARLDWLEAQTEAGPFDPHFPELTRRWLQVTGYQATLREIIDAALSEPS